MMTYKPSKVGHGDLVVVTRSGFASRSAHSMIQGYRSLCSGYDL